MFVWSYSTFCGSGIIAPKMGRPRKFAGGVLVIRPKKRTAPKRVGPDGLSGKWVVPENLPGDEGGATQIADIHLVG